jgi:hypothetical protein
MNNKYLIDNDEADFSKFLPNFYPKGWIFVYKNPSTNEWINEGRLFADKLEAKKAASRLIRNYADYFRNTDFMFAFVQD